MLGALMAGWVLLALVLIAAAEVGYRLHAWQRARRGEARETDEDEGSGYVLSAALGLLGLLIAFVFSMAAQHHDLRRDLVLVEAEAIAGAVQHFEVLPEPHRSRLIATMGVYAKERRTFFEVGDDLEAIDASMARAEALQDEIWAEAVAGVAEPQVQHLTVPVLAATSEMFDAAAQRRAALDLSVPLRAFQVLILYAVVSAAILGHGLAPGGKRHPTSTAGLFVLVALAISLVIDLDSARIGSVDEPQGPMERVVEQVKAKAERAARPAAVGATPSP